jgi:hypothetical protein
MEKRLRSKTSSSRTRICRLSSKTSSRRTRRKMLLSRTEQPQQQEKQERLREGFAYSAGTLTEMAVPS